MTTRAPEPVVRRSATGDPRRPAGSLTGLDSDSGADTIDPPLVPAGGIGAAAGSASSAVVEASLEAAGTSFVAAGIPAFGATSFAPVVVDDGIDVAGPADAFEVGTAGTVTASVGAGPPEAREAGRATAVLGDAAASGWTAAMIGRDGSGTPCEYAAAEFAVTSSPTGGCEAPVAFALGAPPPVERAGGAETEGAPEPEEETGALGAGTTGAGVAGGEATGADTTGAGATGAGATGAGATGAGATGAGAGATGDPKTGDTITGLPPSTGAVAPEPSDGPGAEGAVGSVAGGASVPV